MAEAKVKLTSTEKDVWFPVPTQSGSQSECPVCHCVVSTQLIEEHDAWHNDLAEFLRVLAGG